MEADEKKVMRTVILMRVIYTSLLGYITWIVTTSKGLNHGFWWGLLSIIMIVWTASKLIETIGTIAIYIAAVNEETTEQ